MSSKLLTIGPKLNLGDIFGDSIFNPRLSYSHNPWFCDEYDILDYLTGPPLIISGDELIHCSSATTSRRGIELIEYAGINVAKSIKTYNSKDQYYLNLKEFKYQKKLVVQHVHPRSEISRENCWVSPELLSFLNNKSNLDEIVPKKYIPKRAIVSKAEFVQLKKELKNNLPLVIKIGTRLSTGGGDDVKICFEAKDIDEAIKYFGNTNETIIIEEFLNIKNNFCIQYIIDKKGNISFLGAGEQIIKDGFYAGNWLNISDVPREAVLVGKTISDFAYRKGYTGVVGYDVAVTLEDQIFIFDLNFRLNGSTIPLLIMDDVLSYYNKSAIEFCSLSSVGNYDEMIDTLKTSVDKGDFVPISTYDPQLSEAKGSPRVQGLLLGEGQDVLTDLRADLKTKGIK
ncbi:hypothetical protein ShirakiTB12_54090 [Priestia megaterium]|uniref:ATP-grasp domain-containing protein n=1 Tax=Priestia megaterium TaxID=1404 RepID=A0AAX6BTC6_PRIMG|nr:hypothetical protein [Priestia megaterium]GMG76940.1 hypothetical protein ShirakiTB12_54090 [Priestia megaterium]